VLTTQSPEFRVLPPATSRCERSSDWRADLAIVSAQQGSGLDPAAIDVVTSVQPAGVLVLTVDAFRRDRRIDVELLQKIWKTAGEIGFLIEGEHLADDPAFEYYMIMVMSMNHVRSRDASADWAAFVGRSSQS